MDVYPGLALRLGGVLEAALQIVHRCLELVLRPERVHPPRAEKVADLGGQGLAVRGLGIDRVGIGRAGESDQGGAGDVGCEM